MSIRRKCPAAPAASLEALCGPALTALTRASAQASLFPAVALLVRDTAILAQTPLRPRADFSSHGEMEALRTLKRKPSPDSSPLLLLSSLEPCLMCYGAAFNFGVSKILFALKAPDGTGGQVYSTVKKVNPEAPDLHPGFFKEDILEVFKDYLESNPQNAKATYIKSIITSNLGEQ